MQRRADGVVRDVGAQLPVRRKRSDAAAQSAADGQRHEGRAGRPQPRMPHQVREPFGRVRSAGEPVLQHRPGVVGQPRTDRVKAHRRVADHAGRITVGDVRRGGPIHHRRRPTGAPREAEQPVDGDGSAGRPRRQRRLQGDDLFERVRVHRDRLIDGKEVGKVRADDEQRVGVGKHRGDQLRHLRHRRVAGDQRQHRQFRREDLQERQVHLHGMLAGVHARRGDQQVGEGPGQTPPQGFTEPLGHLDRAQRGVEGGGPRVGHAPHRHPVGGADDHGAPESPRIDEPVPGGCDRARVHVPGVREDEGTRGGRAGRWRGEGRVGKQALDLPPQLGGVGGVEHPRDGGRTGAVTAGDSASEHGVPPVTLRVRRRGG